MGEGQAVERQGRAGKQLIVPDRLDRLERAGLVIRRPDTKDRRGKLIALTEPGKRLIDEAIGRHVANEERLLLSLTEAEQETLSALPKKLNDAIDQR
jgi:DNA-binding MarR family transcriptional regulator